MISGLLMIYACFLYKYQKRWAAKKEHQHWDKWEEYEKMRYEMGHTTDIERIVRPKGKPPRKKHRH